MSNFYSIRAAPSLDRERSYLSKLPILLLNIHSQCNCRCVMCDIWKRKDGTALHPSELDRHRESFQKLGVQHVVLTGGEPLLNRELNTICRFFHDLNIKVTLLTTGLLMAKRAEDIAEHIDDIIISIDGPAAIHDEVRRVPGAFATIAKGVAAVRHYNPRMPITCRTTIQKINHTQLRATVKAAESIGLNGISFLAADLASGAFNRKERWTEDRQDQVALTRSELEALDDEIERLIANFQEEIRTGFIVENATKLRRLSTRFREHLDHTAPNAPLCNAPWVSAVVDIDGSVRPCFFHDPIGNVNHSSLEEAINSTTALDFRDSLDVATNPVCQRCVCSLNYRS